MTMCISEITFEASSRSLGYHAGLPVAAKEVHDAKFAFPMPFFGQTANDVLLFLE